MVGNVEPTKRIKIGDVKPTKRNAIDNVEPQAKIRGERPLFHYVPKVIYLSAYRLIIYLHTYI